MKLERIVLMRDLDLPPSGVMRALANEPWNVTLIPILGREALATMRIAHAIRDHLMQELPIRRDVRT